MIDWLEDELAGLRAGGLLRARREPLVEPGPWVERGGRRLLNLCSNDYLSLAGRRVEAIAGSGASRLIAGDLVEHRSLERALAAWLGTEDALVFSSGYAANVGTIAALAGPGTLVVSDALNHASLIDGCRLSRARVVVVPHLDVRAVAEALAGASERRRLVVTDGYFSMDGTVAPIAGLAEICRRERAGLYVDEAHALGVFGPEGRGVAAEAGVIPDVLMGTLGKAFGSSGAFVAGSAALTSWLWNAARSFVFSTGIAPAAAVAAMASLPEVRGGERTRRLRENCVRLRDSVSRETLLPSTGPILPFLLGAPERAVAAMERLLEEGIFAQAIRPPTVPKGTSRLRVTVHAGHELEDLDRAAEALRRVLKG
ncbi:MAG: 8-amino-7-oxononanoate synthase [Deltaproteobacteria bacterium]|nr:8-amino-7-oxononanoate synthase [Deltaproteobacteria bacterium]